MASDAENPQKSTKKDSDNSNKVKGSKSSKSFFNNLKTSILGEYPIEDQDNKDDDDHKSSERSEVKKSVKNISHNTQEKSKEKDKKESEQINSEDDPAIYFMNNLKDHKRVASLRKRKTKIIRITASIISIILILIGIVYSFNRTQDVASNVIFGERAMFSVFLIMVGFLILAAVFASKLLEGRFLGNISKELGIVEGKNGKDQKNQDQKTQNNNKKNK